MKNKIGSYKTTIQEIDGRVEVQYHSTMIVQFDEHRIMLDTGGWKSATTKRRMNEVSRVYNLGYLVYQSKNEWYCNYHGEKYKFETDSLVLVRKGE